MNPDDRRTAIVSALVPLLVERGGEVTTREIAEAAGIAEGTIFRVFPDKRSLLLAAAEEAMNPAHGQELFDAALEGVVDLREKVVVAAGRVLERMQLTMAVMVAVRPTLVAHFHDAQAKGEKPHIGPPLFVLKAQEDLHARLTGLFAPHLDELATSPEIAAIAMRSLLFGASRPELGMTTVLDPEQVADLLLGGVLRRES
ncbi:MAG: Transcriptional regulator, TetR family [Marmoricola sp.]|nr:Transcriptional regulator, TetR family [Marmoricola sp.]